MANAPDTVYVSFAAEVNQTTTEGLLGLCANLANQGIKTVYLLISSLGGSVTNGITIYNVLRAMPFKLVTHNVGSVNSIANLIFLAGETRYSTPNSTFMFHGVGFDVIQAMRFEEKNLRERLDSIVADQRKIGAIISERSSLKPEEVQELFREAVTRDPGYAKEKGIIHDIIEARIPPGATVHQLVFKRSAYSPDSAGGPRPSQGPGRTCPQQRRAVSPGPTEARE